MTTSPYKLSSQLSGHQADVRSVSTSGTSTGQQLILSASRDGVARIWSRKPSQRDFESVAELSGHEGFVNASAFLQDAGGNIVALTAGQDRIVHGFELQTAAGGDGIKASSAPDYAMIGHEDNVCTLDVGPQGSYIVSGSWDKTAKIWRDFQCVATLKGHQQAVWAVVAVDEDRVLTASADKTIRLWSISQPAKPLATFTGHSDAVRGLVLLDGGASFASCGNDGTINLYSLASLQPGSSSPPLQTLSDHTSFVYSLAIIPGGRGELVSSGEDRSARIWRDGEAVQTITIPAISVWSVAALPNSDVVCGSSDSFVRVFSRDPQLQADAAELQAYEHTIASQALNKTQVGDIRKDNLPGPEALAQLGTKEGQTKMVKNGDVVEAHQWDAGAQSWTKIGEVVGGVGSGQKKLYEGKEYDYVFDVDIADGVPLLKLPYNLSENPYAAAQRFLEANELSNEYADQVVQFIDKNTEGVNLGASTYVDPFTGASRYTGGGASSGGGAGAPPAAPSSFSPTTVMSYTGGNNVDPYTSSAATTGAGRSAAATATKGVLPQRAFLAFATINLAAVKEKLLQLNSEESTKLSADDLAEVDRISTALQQKQAGGGRLEVRPLQKVLAAWKPSSRLPALDLLRCAVAQPVTVNAVEMARTAFEASQWSDDWPSALSPEVKAREVNSMLALRAIANLWNNTEAHGDLAANGISILGSLKDTHFAKLNKNGRVAYATVVYNASAQMVASASRFSAAGLALEMINEVLQQETDDSEVFYRTLMALGNLLISTSSGSLPVGAVQTAKKLMTKWAGLSAIGGEERIKAICAEIQGL